MNPKTQYTKNLTPSLTNVRNTLQIPTKGKTPTPNFMQPDRSKLTLGNKQPSQAWKDFGKNLNVSPTSVVPKMGPVKPTATPSNVSATGTTGTTLPPAGKTFAQNQMGTQLDNIKQQALAIQQKLQAGAAGGTQEKKQDPEYLKYLRSLENPTEASNLQKQRQDALKALVDIQIKKEKQDTDARRRYEELLDESGGLKSGAQQSAAMDRRRSEQELADIALQESAAARTAGVYNDLYSEQLANEKKEGFSLGANDIRYEWDPETKTYKQYGGGGGQAISAYTPGADPVVDSWINFVNGGGDISKVPDQYKNTVVQGLTPTGPGTASPYQQERATRTIQSVDDLLTRVGPWTTGFGSLLSKIPATDARDFQADLNTLKSSVAFSELTAMREASKTGGALGAISDKELILLESALGALDAGQSAANLAKNLQQVKDSIARWQQAVNQYGGGGGTMGGNEAGNPLFDF